MPPVSPGTPAVFAAGLRRQQFSPSVRPVTPAVFAAGLRRQQFSPPVRPVTPAVFAAGPRRQQFSPPVCLVTPAVFGTGLAPALPLSTRFGSRLRLSWCEPVSADVRVTGGVGICRGPGAGRSPQERGESL
ncbi:exported hypothetical protein [Candidatus Sulfopaludibacter sp. SbA3]|nr:exported hypothetical protein [Candidatus Sulfopaludibacter sp. SbA3]